ncbi:MAG: AAA family ATPase [Candidatus Magasanikbacteria bacterium]
MSIEDGSKIEAMEAGYKIEYKPCIIVFTGPPLTGKTTLAYELAKKSNLQVLDVDEFRRKIEKEDGRSADMASLKAKDELEVMIKSYSAICETAKEMVSKGMPVILTGTFSRDEFKKPLKVLFDSMESGTIPTRSFLLTAPDDEIENRIEQRKREHTQSNINSMEKFQWAKNMFKEIDFSTVQRIDTTEPSYVGVAGKLLEDLKK